MEPAKIDWKRIESIFEEDKLYENINAPKWVDFLTHEDSIDDESWFCNPDCNHPKSVEDFLKSTPNSKLSVSAEKLKNYFSDWSQRDGKLNRRGQSRSSSTPPHKSKLNEDGENQNPNFSTPLNYHAKSMKATIKSSTERKNPAEEMQQINETRKLKPILSARNLFAGKDILNQITEFCSELKKMAMRAREKEDDEKSNETERQVGNEGSRNVLREVDVKEKERKALLERSAEKSEGNQKESAKAKLRRKKTVDEAENIPVLLNLANVKHKDEERLLQIRTNPPSPQCFSATRGPAKTSTPSKPSKSRLMERGILQEVKQNKELMKEEMEDKGRNLSIVEGREAKALDVFWFLKPCSLSN